MAGVAYGPEGLVQHGDGTTINKAARQRIVAATRGIRQILGRRDCAIWD